jgi:hypothetical protein
VEGANSVAFWHWLMQIRSDAHVGGLTFAAYCWNASAENQYLHRLGLAGDIATEVEMFITSDEWIDLLKVWEQPSDHWRPKRVENCRAARRVRVGRRRPGRWGIDAPL